MSFYRAVAVLKICVNKHLVGLPYELLPCNNHGDAMNVTVLARRYSYSPAVTSRKHCIVLRVG